MKLSKRTLLVLMVVTLLITLACSAVTVNITQQLYITQAEPTNVSCSNNSWTQTFINNDLSVSVYEADGMKFTGFVFELIDGQIYQTTFLDGKGIDISTYDASVDGIVQVKGKVPGLLYNGVKSEINLNMYLLVCSGKLYYLDFPKAPQNQQAMISYKV